MAGTRQPTAVIQANGRKHLTNTEIDERLDKEVTVPSAKTAKPPKWLPGNLKKEFRAIGKQLIRAGLYTDLDADTLGRYLLACVDYLNAEKLANHYIVARDSEKAKDWSAIQERYFKQCRNCANDMGLTISARCRLVIPQRMNGGEIEPSDEFTRILRQREAFALASSE